MISEWQLSALWSSFNWTSYSGLLCPINSGIKPHKMWFWKVTYFWLYLEAIFQVVSYIHVTHIKQCYIPVRMLSYATSLLWHFTSVQFPITVNWNHYVVKIFHNINSGLIVFSCCCFKILSKRNLLQFTMFISALPDLLILK